MTRIKFDEGGYIEFKSSKNPDKLFIIIAAPGEKHSTIINSVEIDYKQLNQLLSSFNISAPKKKKTTKKKKKKQVESDEQTSS